MPRVDPYREHYNYDRYSDYEPSTAGAITFVAMVAAIVLAAFVWATYAPQNATTIGAGSPSTSQSSQPNPTR